MIVTSLLVQLDDMSGRLHDIKDSQRELCNRQLNMENLLLKVTGHAPGPHPSALLNSASINPETLAYLRRTTLAHQQHTQIDGAVNSSGAAQAATSAIPASAHSKPNDGLSNHGPPVPAGPGDSPASIGVPFSVKSFPQLGPSAGQQAQNARLSSLHQKVKENMQQAAAKQQSILAAQSRLESASRATPQLSQATPHAHTSGALHGHPVTSLAGLNVQLLANQQRKILQGQTGLSAAKVAKTEGNSANSILASNILKPAANGGTAILPQNLQHRVAASPAHFSQRVQEKANLRPG